MKIRYTMIALALTMLVQLSAFAQKPASDNTNVIDIDIKSDNSGSTLYGTMKYSGEGPTPFYGKLHEDNGTGNVAVENKTDDDWYPAGRWVIGSRDDRQVVAFDVSSNDNGKSLNGTMAYADEGEIRVRSKRGNGVVYDVNNQHGGHLHEDGAWVLGARGDKKQYLVAIDITSRDEGKTFGGTITYDREGSLDFRATQLANNSYRAEVYFGDAWHPDGDWIIGGRSQRAVMVSAKSKDGGKTLRGIMKYRGEDPIGLEAKMSGGSAYTVENQWGSTDADWNPGGVFILGSRMRVGVSSDQSTFPEGYFYLTTKSTQDQDFVLESVPLTLQKSGNYTGMMWKATPAGDGYFHLTSKFLEEENQILEGSNGSGAAVMTPDTGVTGTQWKAIPSGDGYYYLTTRFMEDQGKVLDGNVGETKAAASAPFKGAPYMVKRRAAGPSAQWKFIRSNTDAQESKITNSVGMQFKLIPAGKFKMGSPESEQDRADDEHEHEVYITRDYYIGKTEVTQSQWEAVMDTSPWKGEERVREGANIAASYISWNDAVTFCERLSRMEGKTYRLPTEAEWEYACRAGTTTRYSFGDDESQLEQYAWYYDSEPNSASKVERKSPNGFGIYDMHGNVWEYCQDSYDDYQLGSITDPTGPSSGSRRVKRGGSFSTEAPKCRSAYRSVKKDLNETHATSGLRVVMVPAVGQSFPANRKVGVMTADQAKQLVFGSWKFNLEETLKISYLDRDLQKDAVRVVIDIKPHGRYPRLEKLDGENHFELIHVIDGDKVIHDIQFLSKHRMILKASYGFPDIILDRIVESISLDQARKLVLGKWTANHKETKKLNESRPSRFPKLNGNMSVEFRRPSGLDLSMVMRNNAGVSLMRSKFQAGVEEDHFRFGELEIHFLNEDRFILHKARHADVVFDRINPAIK